MIPPFGRSSQHAIRALTHLARVPRGQFVLSARLASELGLPAPFLAKILQPLAARGLLESRRGRGGGFRLVPPPEAIPLLDVVETLEPHDGSPACVLGQGECSDERACPLHGYWTDACRSYSRELAGRTLADLVRFCRTRPESGYPAPGPADARTSSSPIR